MPDLTPPPMSEEQIDKLAGSAFEGFMRDDNDDPDITLARAIEAHVNEQWRQRLEIVGIVGPDRTWFPPVAVVEGGTPLYRIKEQQ